MATFQTRLPDGTIETIDTGDAPGFDLSQLTVVPKTVLGFRIGKQGDPASMGWWGKDQKLQSQAVALGQAYGVVAQNVDPDKEARDQELARTFNIDVSALANPEVRRAAETAARTVANRPDNWNQFVANNPKTAAYLEKERNLAVSHDDLGGLAKIENLFNIGKDALEEGSLAVEEGDIGYAAYSGAELTQDQKDRLVRINNRRAALESRKPKGYVAGGAYGLIGFVPYISGMTKQGVIRGAEAGAATAAAGALAGTVVPGVGNAAGATMGFGTGFVPGYAAGSVEYNFKQMAGTNYLRLKGMRGIGGATISDTNARIASTVGAALAAGLPYAAFKKMAVGIPGVDAFLQSFEKSATEKVLTSNTYTKALRDFTVNYTGAVVTSAAEMAGLEATNIVAERTASALNGNDLTNRATGKLNNTLGEDLKRIGISFVDNTAIFGVGNLPGHSLRLAKASHDVQKAQTTVDWVNQLKDGVDATKTAQRSPSSAADHIRTMADGEQVSELRFPASSWMTYWQKQDPNTPDIARQVAEKMGVDPVEYKAAIESGGDVIIPLDKAVTEMKDHLPALANDMRIHPGDLTLNEAKAAEADEKARIKAVADIVKNSRNVEIDENDPLYQQVLAKVEGAGHDGFSKDKIVQQARLWYSMLKTTQARLGDKFNPAEELKRIETSKPESYKVGVQRYGVPMDGTRIFNAIVHNESGGDYNAVNDFSGARGNIQWMPDTWLQEARKVYGDKTPTIDEATPEQQDRVARAYINRLYSELGSPELVAVAIYAGEENAHRLKRGEKTLIGEGGEYSPDAPQAGGHPSVNQYVKNFMETLGVGANRTDTKTYGMSGLGGDPLFGDHSATDALHAELRNNLAFAKELDRVGRSMDDILAVTGWRKEDDRWKTDLDDPTTRSLYQSAMNANVDPKRMVNVVDLSQHIQQGKTDTPKTLVSFIKSIAKSGVEITSADSKALIGVIGEDANHIVRSGTKLRRVDLPVRNASIRNITDLISNAVLVETTPNTKKGNITPDMNANQRKKQGRKNEVDLYHRFYVPVKFGDKLATVRIVAEDRKGNLSISPKDVTLYDITVDKQTNLPARIHGSVMTVGGSSNAANIGGSKISIRQMLENVKDADKNNYFQRDLSPVDEILANDHLVTADGKDFALFQSSSEPKALWMKMDGGKRIIEIYRSASASSLPHELMHDFLEVYRQIVESGQAPDDVTSDYKALREFAGLKDGEAWTIDGHEKIARAFEQYLAEGKAPSIGLLNTFAKFKRWMVSIFKKLDRNGYEISDEVRGVFDRMLATDEEIKSAEAFYEYGDLIGKEDINIADYRRLVNKATEAAAKAQAEVMAPLMTELKPEYEARMAAAEQQERLRLEKQVAEEPVYRAMQDIEDAAGGRNAKILAQEYVNGTNAAQEVLFSLVAERHGFSSAADMMAAIGEASRYKDEVERRLKSYMADFRKQQRGDLKEQAQEAVHNEKRLEYLAAEQALLEDMLAQERKRATEDSDAKKQAEEERTLREQQDTALTEAVQSKNDTKIEALKIKHAKEIEDLRRRYEKARKKADFKAAEQNRAQEISQRRDENQQRLARIAQIKVKMARLRAREIIASKMVSNAIKFQDYFLAERRSALAAERAYKKGDYEKAAEHKTQQMLMHALAIESILARREVEKMEKGFKRLKNLKADYMKSPDRYQLDKLLARYGLSNVVPETGNIEKPLSLGEWIAAKEQQYGEESINLEYARLFADEVEQAPYKTLTMERLRDLYDAAKNIAHVGREANLVMIDGKKREVASFVVDLLTSAERSLGERNQTRIDPHDRLFDGLRALGDWANANLLTMDTICWLGDGRKDTHGIWHNFFRTDVNTAWNKKQVKMRDVMTNILDLLNQHYSKNEMKQLRKRSIVVKSITETGRPITYTRENILTIALHQGNEGNKQRLRDGFAWTDDQVADTLSHLTRRDWEFVQKVWDYVNSYWPEISKQEERLSGVVPRKVEAEPFTAYLADGTSVDLQGGYWPLAVNRAREPRIADKQGAKEMEYEVPGIKASTRHGFTKARAQQAAYQVRLDGLTVLAHHLEQVQHDLAFREAIMNINKVIYQPEFQRRVNEIFGTEYFHAIEDYVKTVAQGENAKRSKGEKFFQRFRSSMAISTMAFKASVAIPQMLGVIQYAQNLGVARTAAAIANFYGRPDQALAKIKMVMDKSEFMRERMTLADRDVHDSFKNGIDLGDRNTVIRGRDKMNRVGMWVNGFTDGMSSIPCWIEAYKDGLSKYQGDIDKAVDHADSIVRISVGSGRAFDLPKGARGAEYKKWFTLFYSFGSAMYNMAYRSYSMAKNDKKFGQALGFVVGQMLIQPLLNEIFAGRGEDIYGDDDEKRMKAIFRTVGGGVAAPVPFARDIASYLISSWTGEYSTYRAVPIGTVVDAIKKAGFKTYGAFFDGGEGKDAVMAALQLAGYFTPYPQQFNITGSNLYDSFIDGADFEPQDVLFRKNKDRR